MGGQRIDDHSFWAGGASKASPFPEGVKTKSYESAVGAGAKEEYEDTSAAIKSQQDQGIAKAKANKMKPEYRH